MDLPARLGKYELQEFLGGGMSHVYRAKDTVIGRTVAVKILTPEGGRDAETKDRFLQEARMAGNITHENVINIYDFGEESGQLFLVMEYLQGDDLRTLIKSGRAGSLAQRLNLALQASRALEYVHSEKIIHRDVKPDNLHVSTKGVLKLMDFGIAKVEDLSRTRAGFVLGTPYYMAPEQVRGDKITPLIDIYAFGVVLFELIAGVKPFKADTVEQIFRCILMEPLDVTPLKQAQVPQPVVDLILRCTAKNTADRPQTFGEVGHALDQILAGVNGTGAVAAKPGVSAPAAAAGPAVEKAARPKWLLPAIAGVAVLVLIAGFLIYRGMTPASPKAPAAQPTQAPAQTAPQALPALISTPSGEMVLIPAGVFLSGENKQTVSLPAYYIDKTEVTNASYEKYCHERNRPLPPGFSSDHLNFPVVNVTIDDAKDYAEWAHSRLPEASEWEKAARGTDGRKYPWGDEDDPARANVKRDGAAGQLWPVRRAGGDVSPLGVLNMGGNVAEFINELRTPSDGALSFFQKLKVLNPPPTREEPWYTVRGSSYLKPLANAVTYEWGTVPARYHEAGIGFRCVRSAAQAQ